MTTELKSSNIEDGISLTRFHGGNDRGVDEVLSHHINDVTEAQIILSQDDENFLMVHVLMPRDKEIAGEVSFTDSIFEGIHLTQEQALKLAKDLKRFAMLGE